MSSLRTSKSSEDRSSDSNQELAENTDPSSRNPDTTEPSEKASGSKMLSERPLKRAGKRPGRKPSRIDVKAKLERSRQSARECRARKKLRYQYLEELVLNREQAIFALRDELEVFKQWCIQVDKGVVTDKLLNTIHQDSSQGKKGQGQASTSSHLGSSRTSTVTSGTQGYLESSSGSHTPDMTDYRTPSGSRSFEPQALPSSSGRHFPGSHLASQLHGSGAQVHDTSLFPNAMPHSSTSMGQMPRSNTHIPGLVEGHYTSAHFGASVSGSMYPSQCDYPGHSVGNVSNYPTPGTVSQNYINLNNMNIPNTCVGSPDTMTTLTSSAQSSLHPNYNIGPSYNPQASTSQDTASMAQENSWLSLLVDFEPGLSRQGAESACGTPQSVDGVRPLPTVVQDFLDSSDSGSDT
ncbi:uncharacterized protein LOC124149675 [Haliotis rufescens]|uniref:uncharacterized protein LOC124149675 n=1 Tax=Haliotis rufescens TaxID=6454 RepID=UPI001EB01BCD|nr:uncharacterized protein LOC124149675 [Haliotis rufescens]XP_046377372.1 uncharacterized protein LOC124149675 [Haliotis rufescens]XP_046377381.1 uncharacterized protein LOC124149675 [Haliotis rufescens]XP_048248068.1 uncharacterized protein LOC124149675 [Haliotis rufescens]